MKKQIEIRIFPDGKVEANTLGFTGKSCADYKPILEQMLNARTTDVKYKDEYYLTENQEQLEEQEELRL